MVSTGPGRCAHCHWHVPTMGHKADCQTPQSSGEPMKPRYPWGDTWTPDETAAWLAAQRPECDEPWARRARAWHRAQHPEEYPDEPARATHGGRTTTHTDDELEAWCQAGLDDELDEVEADVEGTRNHNLNTRALRCFRLALRAGFDLDDVYGALFDAARVAGAVGNPHTDSQIRKTLRSALTGAHKYGPADPPEDLIRFTEVDAAAFGSQETTT